MCTVSKVSALSSTQKLPKLPLPFELRKSVVLIHEVIWQYDQNSHTQTTPWIFLKNTSICILAPNLLSVLCLFCKKQNKTKLHYKNYNPNLTNLPHLGLMGWVQLVARDFIQVPPPCSPNPDCSFLEQALNTPQVFHGLHLFSCIACSCNTKETKAEWGPYFLLNCFPHSSNLLHSCYFQHFCSVKIIWGKRKHSSKIQQLLLLFKT